MSLQSRFTARTARPRRLGALALVALALLATACLSPEARTFLDRTNQLRSAHGVPALAEHHVLTDKAEAWAAHMAATGRLAHSNLASGLSGLRWGYLGENVGVSEPTGDTLLSLHNSFAASPRHRSVMLDREFTHVGIGVATSADGRVWVAEVFARL